MCSIIIFRNTRIFGYVSYHCIFYDVCVPSVLCVSPQYLSMSCYIFVPTFVLCMITRGHHAVVHYSWWMFVCHRFVLQSVSQWPVVFVQDRHAVAQQLPLIDEQQDYELLGGQEADGQTVITFRRRLDTCDDNDYVINVNSGSFCYVWKDRFPKAAVPRLNNVLKCSSWLVLNG